jgi:hypothetical protein
MKDSKLEMLVTEACATDREIASRTELLKGMKAQLVAEAETRVEDHVPTDGGGWSVTFEGVDGNICRVTKPGDALKPSIDGEGKAIDMIRKVAGVHFSRLFQQAPKWKLVPNFRDQAAALIGPAASFRKLVKLVSKKTPTSVSFETKDIVKVIIVCLLPFLGGCYTPSESEKASFWLKQIAIEEKVQTAHLVQIESSLKRIVAKVNPESLSEIAEEVKRIKQEEEAR